MDAIPRLSDLIPQRNATFVWLMLAGLAVVACLEAMYVGMFTVAPLTTDGRVATFDLEGEGSLAVWFSSGTLELAAAFAAVVFVLRRRTPGSRGAAVWLCAAAAWLVMSIDESASLHEAFKEMMSHATGWRLLGDGTIWWVGAYTIVLSGLGLLLLRAMGPCRAAIVALLAAAAFYTVAVATEMGLVTQTKNEPAVMLEEGGEMIGNLCLLLSMSLSARHAWRQFQAASAESAPPRPVRRAERARRAEYAELEQSVT